MLHVLRVYTGYTRSTNRESQHHEPLLVISLLPFSVLVESLQQASSYLAEQNHTPLC